MEATILGLQWLVNAPAVEAVVFDERGFPAPMTWLDPRHWAAHKLWLSQLDDREPVKKGRDAAQAQAVLALLRDRLPQFSLDADFLAILPGALANQLVEIAPRNPKSTPDW